ncbi:30S ribosomal protein S9 [Candidatus Curtissbacteria bacterium RBG_16_39_7]|uniref:Small ribosomal subunit protein uS9 n=1 Tax=Candidatus Curtissbacteria bacterium RBG_16_39_7 TaxID=1797707 RepID=A0A1F5G1M2_9BACT|nr:MAG: 30S ribosomal protein S9 [Candidatus Curtissbacteria bacterium RBG_16_39_7]
MRIFKGDGKIVVNEKTIEEYFPGTVVKQFWQKPFEVTGTLGRYSATVKVEGSGKSAQLGAVVHGIARSLVVLNPDFRSLLRKAGFLTRDPRAKERRKYGLAQKARKGKQHPKR